MSVKETIYPSRRFRGTPIIPGDKSISHRALIFGALADGKTEIVDILDGADVKSTAQCLQQLGVRITRSENTMLVYGTGDHGLVNPDSILDCGNSGTTMRLLMGVLAGQKIQCTLTGDASLRRRPMNRVADPLTQMGAHIRMTEGEFAPLSIAGGSLQAINYELKIASAQIKTALILAGLSSQGTTCLTGEISSRDHTEKMLSDFGVHLTLNSKSIEIRGGQTLRACKVQVPGDPSTAAFWIAAASIIPGAQLVLENISINPSRLGFLRVLQRMGADIQVEATSEQSEPVGRIRITSQPLKGVRVLKKEIPSLIDEIPLLAVVATQSIGTLEIEGAEELRVKESDRLEAIATNLRAMGGAIEMRQDGFRIEGFQKLQGTKIESYHDHRIAMAFSIAALVAQGPTEILNADCAGVSYPDFFSTLRKLTQ